MATTKILLSGATGRTGREIIRQEAFVDDVKIAAGICRTKMTEIAAIGTTPVDHVKWFRYQDLGLSFSMLHDFDDMDVLVDFSHRQHLAEITLLAVLLNKPLVVGTSTLSDTQVMELEHYSSAIPIFRGGNFRFGVKEFADQAVQFAREHDSLVLMEQHWQGQRLPSEAAVMIGRRIAVEAGKTIQIVNGAPYAADSLINEWILFGDDDPEVKLSYKTFGFDLLARNVLEIAKVMAKKPVKKSGGFYSLDEIWDDLPH